jgi:pyruvate/2-oxoglutarate/acetoin dehydrogenase E1 component
MEGELTEEASRVSLDGARVRRPGRDVTLVTYGASVWRCFTAAEELAAGGIEAEIVDLRSLRPLDDATILESVRRTRRVAIVDEGWRTGGLSGEIAMRVVEQGFYDLDAPIARVCTEEVPIPYPRHLEEAALPNPARIVATVRRMFSDAQ